VVLLETPRLLLEEVALEDTKFVFELLNSPSWLKFIGDRGVRTEQDARNYVIKNFIDCYRMMGYGFYKMTLKEGNLPIGICGFVKRDYLDLPDFGFAMLSAYEGKGYAYEAAIATFEYGKLHLKLNPVLAITTDDNVRSQKLLKKIGFIEIGTVTPPESEIELILFSNE